MPKAEKAHSTLAPTGRVEHHHARRSILGALTSSVVLALPALAAPVSADAALIAKCREVVAAEHAAEACYCYPLNATPAEAKPYEQRADHFMTMAFDAAEAAALTAATTPAGLVAKAQAALALAIKDREGQVVTHDAAQWLAMACLEEVVAVLGVETRA